MSQECPGCGEELTLSERTVRIHLAECPSCHRRYSFLPHGLPGALEEADGSVPPISAGAAPGGESAEADEEEDPDAPVCGECGSRLTIRATGESTIEVECPQCAETTRFRAEGSEPEAPRRRAAPGPRDEGGFGEAPRSRGCRRCGGPIDFEPLPDGGRVGRCRNCGNEFRLPPRREDDRGGGGYGRPRGRGYGRPPGGRDRKPYRRREEDGDEERPRRSYRPGRGSGSRRRDDE